LNPARSLVLLARSMGRRQAIVATAAIGVLALLAAPLVLLSPGGGEKAVRRALDDLRLAAERRDVARFARRVHPGYSGLYGDKDTLVSRFNSGTRLYRDANIRLRGVDITMDGEEALASLEWTWTAVIETDFRSIQTAFFDESWAPARATLRVDPVDGEWKLFRAQTELPRFRAKGATLSGG
jgi:hypothetical protein